MIKKLIGILFTLATLAIIVFTVLGSGRYRSLVWPDDFEWSHLWQRSAGSEAAAAPGSGQTPTPKKSSAPAAQPAAQEDVQADYFEDAEDDLPSDLFMEEGY